eukprot:1638087-Alexandrium_andersonii.AAC.1
MLTLLTLDVACRLPPAEATCGSLRVGGSVAASHLAGGHPDGQSSEQEKVHEGSAVSSQRPHEGGLASSLHAGSPSGCGGAL